MLNVANTQIDISGNKAVKCQPKPGIASCLTAEDVTVSLFSSHGLGCGWAVGSGQVTCT